MAAELLDGKAFSRELAEQLATDVKEFVKEKGIVPTLAAVLIGEDPASQVYVRNKDRACKKAGIKSLIYRLPDDTQEQKLLALVHQLNDDQQVHGILVQLPLPRDIRETKILDSIAPFKDVDAFHPENVGLLSQGRPRFLPCTPHGVQQILHRYNLGVSGKHVVVVGRSEIVGKPLSLMLVQRDSALGAERANATVTICHSRTTNLGDITRQADILVAAIGKPKFITSEMVKPGAVVIDVGINHTEAGLVGDVDFSAVREVAGHITPVPGGIGPLTIAMLMRNTFTAARLQSDA